MKSILLVFIGGGIGAVLRYLISKATFLFYQGNFPLGTLISNFISCLIVGLVVYWVSLKHNIDKGLLLVLITGICGGLSTFSTFSYETFELFKLGFWSVGILNIVLSLLVGIGILFAFYHKSLS